MFVGRQVAEAFGFRREKLDWFQWTVCDFWKYRCSVIPHTSGCNHFWNSPENREQAQKFFQEIISSK
ncbi:gp17 [Alphaproteobacteria phage PhiJL001]|uniref:Gp17 n=1 Tax=Alphaproteobacteria phage PhiJL001 TaxID=2681607 RepID=Q5DN88_9CAUD|nr:gp17 [Alphaproteobacteria phage PhiJL001]AAT69493.1 gp17 [Alphaproteobacteria phage PhiJL001]